MWEWIYKKSQDMLKGYSLTSEDKDDIIQETILRLFNTPDVAQRIYGSWDGLSILRKQLNYSVLAHNASKYFDDARDYCIYKKILKVCEEYNIAPLAENAYKIAPLINTLNGAYTIASVEKLLSNIKPTIMSLDAMIENGCKEYS